MSSNQPVDAAVPRRLLVEPEQAQDAAPAPDASQPGLSRPEPTALPAVTQPDTSIATVTPPPPLVVGVPTNPRTGEPRRPAVIVLATIACWLAVAISTVSLLWVYWDAISRFAQASWLMGQFATEPGSTGRVLLAVAVTVIVIVIGVANAIVGYYAWTGYRWTRVAGIISAVLTFGTLTLNQLGWYAIPAAVIGAGLLWLPPAAAFFLAWQARRHPAQVFAPPTLDVAYGPLPRYRKD